MVKFTDEGPEDNVQIYTVKTQIGHEKSASDALSGRIKRSTRPTGICSVLSPAKLRGYIFVEAENPELLKDTIRGLTHVRGMLMVPEWKGRKSEPGFGTVPFREGDIAYHHRHTPPPDLRECTPDLPDALARLVRKLMAKDAADRCSSAAEVASGLHALLDEL